MRARALATTPTSSSASSTTTTSITRAQWKEGDIIQLRPSLLLHAEPDQCSYGLYDGRDRILHAWSCSRQGYRVRLDSIRVLESMGFYPENVTSLFDTYCTTAFHIYANPAIKIIPKAKKLMHYATSSRRSSLLLVLWARYSAVQADDTLMKLLRSARPLIAKLDVQEVVPKSIIPDQAKQETKEPKEIKPRPAKKPTRTCWMFGSKCDAIVSEWLMISFTLFLRDRDSVTKNVALMLRDELIDGARAVLVFDRSIMQFRLAAAADQTLPERLASDNLECGICFADMRAITALIFQCTHYICEACYEQLRRKTCPYCRATITTSRVIADSVKELAVQVQQHSHAQTPTKRPSTSWASSTPSSCGHPRRSSPPLSTTRELIIQMRS